MDRATDIDSLNQTTVTVALVAVSPEGQPIQGVRPRLVTGVSGQRIDVALTVTGYRRCEDELRFPMAGGGRLAVTFAPLAQTARVVFRDRLGRPVHPALPLKGVSDAPLPRAEVFIVRQGLMMAGYRIVNDDTFGAQFARTGEVEAYTVLVELAASAPAKRHWWQRQNVKKGDHRDDTID